MYLYIDPTEKGSRPGAAAMWPSDGKTTAAGQQALQSQQAKHGSPRRPGGEASSCLARAINGLQVPEPDKGSACDFTPGSFMLWWVCPEKKSWKMGHHLDKMTRLGDSVTKWPSPLGNQGRPHQHFEIRTLAGSRCGNRCEKMMS